MTKLTIKNIQKWFHEDEEMAIKMDSIYVEEDVVLDEFDEYVIMAAQFLS